jgi:chemotaxis protein CheZ
MNFDETEIERIEEEFTGAVREFMRQKNCEIYKEIRKIVKQIDETRGALASGRTLAENPLSNVQDEIGAVLKHNERAADKILSSCEDIQKKLVKVGKTDAPSAEAIAGSVNAIFEACDFQDLSGQRLTKVAETLDFIDESIGNLVTLLVTQTKAEQSEADMLRHGPQLNAASQDDIDRLFDMI